MLFRSFLILKEIKDKKDEGTEVREKKNLNPFATLVSAYDPDTRSYLEP